MGAPLREYVNSDSDIDAPPVPHRYPPESLITKVGFRFFRRHHQIFEFLFFNLHLAGYADEGRRRAIEVLAKNGTVEDAQRLEDLAKEPTPALSKLSTFGNYQSEIMVIRSVDNFTTFLAEMIEACIERRPELLHSQEQIKVEEVLQISNKRDLVSYLINRKINELAYQGLKGIEEFFDKRLNIPITEESELRDWLSFAIELRNIYTHNRGIVNHVFVKRIRGRNVPLHYEIGKRCHANYEDIIQMTNRMFLIAERLDQVCAAKYKIKRKRYGTWSKPKLNELSK